MNLEIIQKVTVGIILLCFIAAAILAVWGMWTITKQGQQTGCSHVWCLVKLKDVSTMECKIQCAECGKEESRLLSGDEYTVYMANAWRLRK